MMFNLSFVCAGGGVLSCVCGGDEQLPWSPPTRCQPHPLSCDQTLMNVSLSCVQSLGEHSSLGYKRIRRIATELAYQNSHFLFPTALLFISLKNATKIFREKQGR